jgi:hypothetical protein
VKKINLKILRFVCNGVETCVLIGLMCISTTRVAAQQRLYTGNENHAVSLDQAVKCVQNFAAKPEAPTIKGGYFGRNIFDKLLSQGGCVGIRYYYAKTDSGVATIVLVGVDSTGNDLYQGIIAEQSIPCPPWCSASNPLNK